MIINVKKILYNILCVIILCSFNSCVIPLAKAKRSSITSAKLYLFVPGLFGGKKYSHIKNGYKEYAAKATKINLSEAQVNRLNQILKDSKRYYIINVLIGSTFAFIQIDNGALERGCYFSISLYNGEKRASIIDTSTRKLYKIENEEDFWFLYDLTNLSQNTTPAWLEMQERIKLKQ